MVNATRNLLASAGGTVCPCRSPSRDATAVRLHSPDVWVIQRTARAVDTMSGRALLLVWVVASDLLIVALRPEASCGEARAAYAASLARFQAVPPSQGPDEALHFAQAELRTAESQVAARCP